MLMSTIDAGAASVPDSLTGTIGATGSFDVMYQDCQTSSLGIDTSCFIQAKCIGDISVYRFGRSRPGAVGVSY
jgi:hypothetical protein